MEIEPVRGVRCVRIRHAVLAGAWARWSLLAVVAALAVGAAACSSPADGLGEVVDADVVVLEVDVPEPVRVTSLSADTLIVESLPPFELFSEGSDEILRGNWYFHVDPATGEARRIDVGSAWDGVCAKPAGYRVGRSALPDVVAIELRCLKPDDTINLVEVDTATGELVSLTPLSQGAPQAPLARIELLDDTRYLVTVGGICDSLGIVDTTSTGVTAAQTQGLSGLDWDLSQGFQQVFCDTLRDGGFVDIAVSTDRFNVAVVTVDYVPAGPAASERALWTGTTSPEGLLTFEGPIESFDDPFAVDFVGGCVVIGDGGRDAKLVAVTTDGNVVVELDVNRLPEDMTHIPGTSKIAVVTDTGDETTLHIVDLAPWCPG